MAISHVIVFLQIDTILTSSLCPICEIYCEDMLHGFFQCPRVGEIWKHLDLSKLIREMITVDRSSSEVLEAQLLIPNRSSPLLSNVGIKELINTSCWYILWQRRQVLHGENISSPGRSAQAILVITTNYFRARKKNVKI
jgi:hypothetical protein